jgi:protocatechuate 3,4-dioxygenase beta subunit
MKHAAAWSRRRLIGGLGAGAVLGGLAIPTAAAAQRRRGEAGLDYPWPEETRDLGLELPPTPECRDGDAEPTRRQTEGPFYKPETPERTDFSADGEGAALVLVGRVLTPQCEPLPRAVLDFWHADSEGRYDGAGFRFRGHVFTDASGAFRLTTIKPSGYGYASAARPPHIHVKAQAPDTALLTTQLYFPDESNASDRIFRDSLLVDLSEDAGVLIARFDFVLAA